MTDQDKVKSAVAHLDAAASHAVQAHGLMTSLIQTDTTAPVVSGVQITPTETAVRVQFKTDEPAMVVLNVGTEFKSDANLNTDHDLTIEGLTEDTTYDIQIGAEDDKANRDEKAWTGTATTKAATGGGTKTDTIEQFGITRKLTAPVVTGQFCTGDPWVLADTAVVSSISPSGDGRDGSMLNPGTNDRNGYGHAKDSGYNKDNNVALKLPLSLSPGDSLVSTIFPATPYPSTRPMMDWASVLSVVSERPADDAFRPGISGKDAPRFRVADLNMSILPKLSIDGTTMPPIEDIKNRMARPWLDHLPGWTGREGHPAKHMPDYGRNMCKTMGEVALAVCSDIPEADKLPMVIGLVQWGIDLMDLVENGVEGSRHWMPNGGHASGRKWPILFAGLILGDAKMQAIGSRNVMFGEDAQTYYVTQEDINRGVGLVQADLGKPMWGLRHNIEPQNDGKWGYNSYQYCCTANAWHGMLLAAHAMGAKSLWKHYALFDYQDRYVEVAADNNYVAWQQAWGDGWALEMWKKHRASFGNVWTDK